MRLKQASEPMQLFSMAVAEHICGIREAPARVGRLAQLFIGMARRGL
jgi:hypothetical protein